MVYIKTPFEFRNSAINYLLYQMRYTELDK